MLELISGNNKEQRRSNNIVLLRSQLTFFIPVNCKLKEKGRASARNESVEKNNFVHCCAIHYHFLFLNAHLFSAFVNGWSFEINLCNTSIKADDAYLPLPEMCNPRRCVHCQTDHEGRNECESREIYSDTKVAHPLN